MRLEGLNQAIEGFQHESLKTPGTSFDQLMTSAWRLNRNKLSSAAANGLILVMELLQVQALKSHWLKVSMQRWSSLSHFLLMSSTLNRDTLKISCFFMINIMRGFILYFVLLMKSHLQSYPCPLQINSFWNLGFLLGIAIILQIITGIFLGLHYTSDLNSAYSSIFFFIREIFYGWCLRYLHSSGASFVFLFLFLHLGRAISYGSYFYNPNTWFSGIILFFFLMATAFMGYVLPFGQLSYWGATVITNLLSPFPSFIEWVSGGHYVYNPTLKRFFLFHFIFPFLLCGFRILHLFYLHFLSSNNPLRNSTNN